MKSIEEIIEQHIGIQTPTLEDFIEVQKLHKGAHLEPRYWSEKSLIFFNEGYHNTVGGIGYSTKYISVMEVEGYKSMSYEIY